ncbi:MAG: hypothetical protein HKN17_08470 [Rhodothermales bacterium]|nr:hypothetical protein [Rhodothermales bacterium]
MTTSDRFISFAAGVAIALALHLVAGWMFSPLGAVAAAWLRGRGTGILIGAVVLSGSWLLLITYNFVVAPAASAELTRVVAGIAGLGPGAMTIVLTCLVAALLGAAGGGVGGALRRLRER